MACQRRFNYNSFARRSVGSSKRSRISYATHSCQPLSAKESESQTFPLYRQKNCRAMDSYFLQNVFPVLTPLAFDPGRPFPHISSGSLNLAVVVGDNQGTENFARVKVPDSLPRLVPVISSSRQAKISKSSKSERTFVWLEQLITANLHLLFPGMEIVEASPFRVTRDAEVAIQELESDDLLESVEEAMRQFKSRPRELVSYPFLINTLRKPRSKMLGYCCSTLIIYAHD